MSSESTIYVDDFKEEMCAKLFSNRDTWLTLVSVDEGSHKDLHHSSHIFHGNSVKVFEMAAIEDNNIGT